MKALWLPGKTKTKPCSYKASKPAISPLVALKTHPTETETPAFISGWLSLTFQYGAAFVDQALTGPFSRVLPTTSLSSPTAEDQIQLDLWLGCLLGLLCLSLLPSLPLLSPSLSLLLPFFVFQVASLKTGQNRRLIGLT